jgi:hypothetical protein
VLDPLAALLLAARRALGHYLAIVVFVTDACANGYAVYGLAGGRGIPAVAQAVVTLVAVGALLAVPVTRPHLLPAARRRRLN